MSRRSLTAVASALALDGCAASGPAPETVAWVDEVCSTLRPAAARRADARASEATASQVRAAVNAALADQLAARAAGEATSALRAALYTRQEAEAAEAEAVSAATQAQAAVRAATAARTSARGIADPANNAIRAVAPFTGADVDADFITEVARMAGQVGEEQAQAAGVAANEAVIASQQATDAANRAAAQVKPAYEAAARAAESAAAAAQSSARAARAAADAAVDGAAARAADAGAAEAAAQARSDAAGARRAADLARQDAAIAGRSAEAATADAAAATAAAEGAERDAAAANAAAASAQQSAVSARAAADRAEEHAAGAAAAAVNASNSAIEAQQTADRAEAEARRLEAEKRRQEADAERQRQAAIGGGGGGGGLPSPLPATDEELLQYFAGTEVLDFYRQGLSDAGRTFVDFLRENGADILLEVIGYKDAERCFGEGNVEACLWTIVNVVSIVVVFAKLPAITAAIVRISAGVSAFIRTSQFAARVLDDVGNLVTWLKGCRANSFVPGTRVLLGNGSTQAIERVRVGDLVLATDPATGRSEPKPVTDVITGEGSKQLVDITVDTDGTAGHATAVITATGGHPLWSLDRQRWLDAADVVAGTLLGVPSEPAAAVLSVAHRIQPARVHNLTVSDLHTFSVLAADVPLLTHNCGGLTLTHIGQDRYRTPAGLIYEPMVESVKPWREGHRIYHIGFHAAETLDPRKKKVIDGVVKEHSIFSGQISPLELIDEAWVKRGKEIPQGKTWAFDVKMGRVVGYEGETTLRIVVKTNTSIIVTAFPKK